METICIAGRLGEDAKVKQFENNNAVINFAVAVNGIDKGERVSIWYGCSLWRKTDKTSIAEHLKKGTAVALSGRPSVEIWTDKQGLACGRIHVDVDNITLQGNANNQTQSQ